MKQTLIALTTASALAFGTMAAVRADDHGGLGARHGERGWHHGSPLDRLDHDLNLTDAQKAKIQPIVDQAKPQMKAIHEEAMQKAKAVMDNAMSQIRPLLTPEQQQKLDAINKAHDDMRDARKEMRDAKSK